jgi:hypothetical protein
LRKKILLEKDEEMFEMFESSLGLCESPDHRIFNKNKIILIKSRFFDIL